MKRQLGTWLLVGLLAAGFGLAGCGTTVYPDPALGPVVKKGYVAVFPQVADNRAWPSKVSREKTPNIRVFQPEITSYLRRGLVGKGLFKALPSPHSPAAKGLNAELAAQVTAFQVEKISPNSWLVPHMLFNGLVLPVYSVANVATGGETDLGGYIFPSNTVATDFRLNLRWVEQGIASPVLNRDYQVKVELGSASERTVYNRTTRLTRQEGLKALEKMVETVARDPYWLYLDQFRTLTKAELLAAGSEKKKNGKAATGSAQPQQDLAAARSVPLKVGIQPMPGAGARTEGKKAKKAKPLTPRQVRDKITAANMAIAVVQPLEYTPQEAKALLDPYFDADRKAAFLNEVRAQLIGLKDEKELPAAQRITAEQAKKLYDEPGVQRSLPMAELAKRAFSLVGSAISDPRLSPKAGEVRKALKTVLTGHPRLQKVFLAEADKAVNDSWPAMKTFLQQVNSPMVLAYLNTRK